MIRRVTTEAQFRIKYEGEDEHYHELDASLLAQALMGFSELGRLTYRTLHPEDTHTLNVRVLALEAGSFEIALEAVVPALEHLYGQFVGLFNRSDSAAVANAGGVVGVIASAFGFIKWLGGRSHEADVDGDTTTVTTSSGDTTTVPSVVYNIAGNATFVQAAGSTLAPLDDPHYDRMSIRDARGRDLDTTHEDDRGYFRIDSDELDVDETLTLEVAIETVQVTAPDKVWTFRSGDQRFNAKMLDPDFLNYVKNVGVRVNGESRAIVERREVRKRASTGATRSQFFILKVHQIINPGESPIVF